MGAANGDQLGTVVGSAGDINGDGHPDIFASAPYNDAGGNNAGAIYIWYGGPGMHTTPDLTIPGSAANEQLTNAANAGDINADGYSDLITSELHHVRVFFGGPTPNTVPDLTLTRSVASIAGAGDVNGDGVDDFVIGEPNDDGGGVGAGAGRVSVFFGGSSVDTVEDMSFVGDRPQRYLGLCVAGAGHLDGPGPTDLIAGATDDPEGIGYNRGRAYVFENSYETTAVPAGPATPDATLSFLGPEPNPSWNEVRLAFALGHAVPVSVSVFDPAGHLVARPVQDEWIAGRATRTWRPAGLPSGIYFVSAKLGDREELRRMVWLGH